MEPVAADPPVGPGGRAGGTEPHRAETAGTPAGRAEPDQKEVAEAVRDAVLAVPGVVRLYAGPFGEIATYLPGRRVRGIRTDDTGTDVHVVLLEGVDLRATARAIHRAATAAGAGPVRVHIDDLAPQP